MQPDSVIQAQIDDLLRTDPRLLAASPLIGQVFALITEPKPPTAKKTRRPRKAPPRVDTGLSVEGCTTTVTFHASDAATLRDAAAALRQHAEGDSEEDEQTTPSGPPPWLKFCKVKKVPNEYRALFGDRALAVVVVDGWLWARADAETRRAGLVLALRGLEHQERASDGADACRRTAPPLQTWPDCVDELSHLVAAFTDDPAAAAGASNAAEALWLTPADRAGDAARDQAHVVGHVGGHGRHAEGDQRRERDQRARARDGVDEPGPHTCERDQEQLQRAHEAGRARQRIRRRAA